MILFLMFFGDFLRGDFGSRSFMTYIDKDNKDYVGCQRVNYHFFSLFHNPQFGSINLSFGEKGQVQRNNKQMIEETQPVQCLGNEYSIVKLKCY